MKTALLLLISTYILFIGKSFSQSNCEVLVPNLIGQYEGGCKKGLASGEGIAIGIDQYNGKFKKGLPHGYGVYKWSTGEIYEGDWNKGVRHGIGKHMVQIEEDSLMTLQGIWENDTYKGEEDLEPKVFNRQSVDYYKFNRIGDGNSLKLTVYRNGVMNGNVTQLFVSTSSGKVRYSGGSFNIDAANFPLNCDVLYRTYDPIIGRISESKFKFVIPESGDWLVEVHNN